MNDPIASGYLKWANAHWEDRCPEVDYDERCWLILDDFTTHTKLCPVHGTIDIEQAIHWPVCA